MEKSWSPLNGVNLTLRNFTMNDFAAFLPKSLFLSLILSEKFNEYLIGSGCCILIFDIDVWN